MTWVLVYVGEIGLMRKADFVEWEQQRRKPARYLISAFYILCLYTVKSIYIPVFGVHRKEPCNNTLGEPGGSISG